MFFQKMGSNTVFTNTPVIDYGDVLILSVKPQVVSKVLPEFRIHDNKKLLISVAMGISLASLEKVTRLSLNQNLLTDYGLSYKLLSYYREIIFRHCQKKHL